MQEPGEEVEALLADADARPRVPKLAGHGIVVDVLLAPQLPELLELLGPSRGREILHKGAVRVEELLEVGRLLQVDQVQKTVDENGVQEALQVLLGRRDRIKSGAAREAREANVVQHSWGMEDGPRGTRDRSEMGGGGLSPCPYPVDIDEADDEVVELPEARGVAGLPLHALREELAHHQVLEVVVLEDLLFRRHHIDTLFRREVLQEGLLGLEALVLVKVLDHDPVQVACARLAPERRHGFGLLQRTTRASASPRLHFTGHWPGCSRQIAIAYGRARL